MLDLLSQGLSGTEIAERLFLSPETVRTHVRNAMAKLGASTRSQAVAIALQRAEIGEETAAGATDAGSAVAPPQGPARPSRDTGGELPPTLKAKGLEATLGAVLAGLATLYDVEGGAIFLVDDDGLTLRRVALVGGEAAPGAAMIEGEESLALGDGPLGRAALERRPQIVRMPGNGGMAAIAAPMYGNSRLVGLLCLTARPSRPLGRNELLLLQAFSSRLAEVIVAGGEGSAARLKDALERFRSSWAGGGSRR